MFIIINTHFISNFNFNPLVGLNCLVLRSGFGPVSWSVGLFFALSLGRLHRQHPFVQPTAAKGQQYLPHNIMHRRSHQSPQCRTVTITRAPATQDGSVRGGIEAGIEKYGREKQTITSKLRIMLLPAMSAAFGDFCKIGTDK